jgi:pimeloyl-ACP methyl ester carboxylesterase
MARNILLLHGFASSSASSKAGFLANELRPFSEVHFRAFEFNPTPRDFEFMTVTGLIDRLRQYLLDQPLPDLSLIGSSLGGLTGLHYAHRFGGVKRLLLLAPALAFRGMGLTEEETERWGRRGERTFMHYAFDEQIPLRYAYYLDGLNYQQPVPPPCPIHIIHGRGDEIVPIEFSRQYTAGFPQKVKLIEVESDHRLADQMPLIWQQVQSFLLA